MMMNKWEEVAHIVEDVYGGYVDWDEEFYICPECEEPIYADDWSDISGTCPICDFLF